jgi:hypothetical protein
MVTFEGKRDWSYFLQFLKALKHWVCFSVFIAFCWKSQSSRCFCFLALFYSQSWHPVLVLEVLRSWMAIIFMYRRWRWNFSYVGDHLKKTIATISWIWTDCFWRRQFWISLIHEEGQIGSPNNTLKCCWFSVASCNTCKYYKECMGQSLCNIWKKRCWQQIVITSRVLHSLDGGRHFNVSSYWQASNDCRSISKHWSSKNLWRFGIHIFRVFAIVFPYPCGFT